MLQSMRKSAKSWVMVILFGLLILSFAVWGIGDVFRPGVSAGDAMATIGDRAITAREYRAQLVREIDAQRQRLKISLTFRQAYQLGLANRVLQDMINDELFMAGAQDLGVTVSTDQVVQQIQQNRNFRNRLDRFDRQTFLYVLRQNNLTEAGYIALRQREIARSQFTSALVANETSPRSLNERIYRYQNEQRVAEIVEIADASVKAVPEPSSGQINAYYKKHPKRYTAPELRAVTAIVLTPQSVAARVKVTDDELKKAYEENKASFTTKEKRTVEQVLFSSEALAKKGHAALKAGDSFEKVAKEIAKQSDGPLSLGTVEQEGLPLKVLGTAAFRLEKGGFSAPIKSDLGWHILRVTEIKPGSIKSFDQVKAQLRSGIQKERASDLLVKLGEQVEDELGAGTTLEEAGRKLKLKVIKIAAVDARGNDRSGKKIADLPKPSNFLSEAFKQEKGEDSGLLEGAGDAAFVIRIDKITKPALRPINEVKAEIVKSWKAERRREAAVKRAKALLEKLKGGFTLAGLAKKEELTLRTTKPFKRDGRAAGKGVSGPLVEKLFKAKIGQTVMAEGTSGVTIAALKEVKRATPNAADMKKIRQAVVQAINQDMIAAVAGALRGRHKVEVNEEAIRALFAQVRQ